MLALALVLGCSEGEVDTGAAEDCPEGAVVTDYAVEWTAEPEPTAGEETTFALAVRDQRGCPVPDLQIAHERAVHTLFVSADLASFQHLHHEDFAALEGQDLKDSSFRFPVTFPLAGDYRAVFDYAHQNAYLTTTDWLAVGGAPGQAAAPELPYASRAEADGLGVELRWDVEPAAGFEASWTVTVTDADGAEVTDLVQWLGADAHAALVSADLGWVSHTHAWFPGMEDVAPGHDMPALYNGPEVPFHYTFPTAGPHKMWVQLARASAPGDVTVVAFAFDVAP